LRFLRLFAANLNLVLTFAPLRLCVSLFSGSP